jgi:hypothetical protein
MAAPVVDRVLSEIVVSRTGLACGWAAILIIAAGKAGIRAGGRVRGHGPGRRWLGGGACAGWGPARRTTVLPSQSRAAGQRRQMASAAAIAARTIQMTVPPASTLSTFATKTPDGARISSIHRSHWWSAGCTNNGVRATMAISALARARQATPPSTQAGAASLSRPPWPPDRLRVSSGSCPGWLIGMKATAPGYCP